MLRREALHSACALALVIGGCPRHSANRVTYLPPPPAPAAATAAASGGALVIEEPPPPPPPEPVVLPAPVNPAPVQKARRPRAEAPPPEKPAEKPTPAPALQPLAGAAQDNSWREDAARLQQQLTKRIEYFDALDLKPADHEALDDARAFLAQSLRALADGDAQRSLALGRKASLLLDALERHP